MGGSEKDKSGIMKIKQKKCKIKSKSSFLINTPKLDESNKKWKAEDRLI